MAHRVSTFLFLLTLLFVWPVHADPISATIAAVAAGVGAGSAIAAGVITWGFSWGAFAASMVMSAASALLSPKGKSSSFDSVQSGTSQQFRQAVPDREIVYGQVRKSGAMAYMPSTGGNKYQHLVVLLATHEVKRIGEIIVGDESITDDMLDNDGNVIAGRYSGFMRIRKHLGSPSQAADSFLVAECPEWTENHKLSGIAYLAVRMTWSQSKFPSGIPAISAWIDGKLLKDPRDGVIKFSQNLPLMIRDYLTDVPIGMAVEEEFVNDEICSESANIADEYIAVEDVTANILSVDQTKNLITVEGDRLSFQLGDKLRLSSGSIAGLSSGVDYFAVPYQRTGVCRLQVATSYLNACSGVVVDLGAGSVGVLKKIAEPRYHGGGIFKMSAEPIDNIQELVSCCAGMLPYAGGTWRIYVGSYRLPSIHLSEADLAGPMTMTTKISKRDRFNRIQGTYKSPVNDGNAASYPVVKNDYYEATDGRKLKKDFDQPFTQRSCQAQRVSKILLESSRQEIIISAPFKLTAFKLQLGDTFYFSFARYGFVNKIFEVTNWKIVAEGAAPVIQMTIKETSSSCFEWNSGEETRVDPAPNTSLSSVLDVDYPTDINITVGEVATEQGDKTYEFKISWTPPEDGFVTEGGKFEVEFKESDATKYRPSYRVDGRETTTQINQVRPGVSYDIRIRSINAMGVTSDWTYYVGFTVNSTVGASTSIDYGFFSETETTFLDDGDFIASPSFFEDDGAFS